MKVNIKNYPNEEFIKSLIEKQDTKPNEQITC